ncbi:glycerophosphodiester phosphodiesterase family protein [Qipengyuania gelatinilytica]|uniref:glycerophosphodiester phosphodiesterase n=1 Tax=Qipengyuania gelatinilytica TaxID=2867231 RepID=A0ABX9A528_9SPHN|nr:glycerophosphodiester phosphodiesterase family protein [Qipengyuania gelatinilytica]QZD96377.1 glycerophosphodiester phosphodiesterase [Qipengyuania gelatinilytica]
MLGLLFAGTSAFADEMLVIAHRGASGERPEHTLAAYERAIDQGADYIEPDLVVTKDLVLVARHENELSDTTDVAAREEFADRRRSKTIDGRLVSGWFAEDFTLAEIRSLRAKERLPGMRPANARFDGLYSIPTFAEIVQLVRAKEVETGRTIGLYPELKHPTFLLQDEGIDSVDLLVRALREADLDDADDAVFVQSFEVGPLRRLDRLVDVPLVQLVKLDDGPADEPALRYDDMVAPVGLAEIATYADAIGADLRLLFGPEGIPSGVVDDAKEAGLDVHAWTLRKENAYLPPMLRRGEAENGTGDMLGMVTILKAQGIDGVFTDDPGLVVSALAQ